MRVCHLPWITLLAMWGVCLAETPADPARHLVTGRYGAAATAIGGTVYVAGGTGARGLLETLEEFDLATGASRISPLRITSRRYFAAAAWSNGFFLVGGEPDYGGGERLEWVVPSAGTVQRLSPLPRPRSFASAVIARGRLIVVGGNLNSNTRCGYVDLYDIASNTWSRGPDMPTSRDTAVVVISNQLYALGGYNGIAAVDTVERLDLDRMVWERLPPLPRKQSAHRAVYDGNRVYLFGDYLQLDRVVGGQPETGEWTLLEVPYAPARHTAAALAGDSILLLGGNTKGSDSHLDLIQVFSSAHLQTAAEKIASPDVEPDDAWEPAARTLILQSADHMSRWSNVLIRGRLDYGYSVGGIAYTASAPYELIYERPHRLLHRTGDWWFWYDGTNVAALKLYGRVWQRMEAGGEAAIHLGHLARGAIRAMPTGHRAILNAMHRTAFVDNLKHAQVTAESPRAWQGRTLHPITVHRTNLVVGPVMPDFRIGIDPATGLTLLEESLQRAAEPAGPATCRAEIEEVMNTLAYRFEASEAAVNTVIPPDTFTPPRTRPTSSVPDPSLHPYSWEQLLAQARLRRIRRQNPTTLTVPVRLVWSKHLCAENTPPTFGQQVLNRIPTTHVLSVSNESLFLIDLRDGSSSGPLPFPKPETTQTQVRGITGVWLAGGDQNEGLVAFAINDSDPATAGRGARRIVAYDTGGRQAWTLAVPGVWFDTIMALPCGRGQPMMLAIADHDIIRFYDAAGAPLGDVDRTGTDVVELSDRDNNGLIEITVLGENITRYEWTATPTPTPP